MSVERNPPSDTFPKNDTNIENGSSIPKKAFVFYNIGDGTDLYGLDFESTRPMDTAVSPRLRGVPKRIHLDG